MLHKKIIEVLKKAKAPHTQAELARKIPKTNRAVLLGYLRCLSDLGLIKSKLSGRTLVYYL